MLDVLWQVVALTVCVAALGFVLWDGYLRDARAPGRAWGVVAIGLLLLGGWALAQDSLLWLPALAGSVAIYVASRDAPEQRSE